METVSPNEGDRADFPRLGNRYVIRGEATGGRFALLEHTIPPRALAAPTLAETYKIVGFLKP